MIKKLKPLLCIPLVMIVLLLHGCDSSSSDPITITVWHYYNGTILNAFDSMVNEFNDTIGKEKGIIVEGYSHGNLSELEKAVIASADKEVGSMNLPNIFASYADTAYQSEERGILADLGAYFDETEQSKYISSYIEEGKIGSGGELRIFPIAKSTEMLMLNETDWIPFSEEYGLTYGDLSTLEGLAATAELYYIWTDEKTPDVLHDGKAFFGRDSIANLFVIESKSFGKDIFTVYDGNVTLDVDREVMRKIWDYYYVPYISGHYLSLGKFRSDDAKAGDILAYVGSTSSAAYFPKEVTKDGQSYSVTAKILPYPHFSAGKNVLVQQGAGMVVTKSTTEKEAASVEFLKWFTDVENNIEFSALSGYIPVKTEAIDIDVLKTVINESGFEIDPITEETLKISFESVIASEMYTNKAFNNATAARSVLENHLQDKADADRLAVIELVNAGVSYDDAVRQFAGDEQFYIWFEDFKDELSKTVYQ